MNPNLAGILAMLMWSSLTTILAFNKNIPPFELAGISWLIGFTALGGFYLLRGEKLIAQFKRPLTDYAFASCGIFVYTALLYLAFSRIPAFEANALNYLWPVFLMLFLSIFQKVPMTLTKIAGMGIAFAGCLLLFFYRYNDVSSGQLGLGHIFGFLAAVIWALYSCFAKTRNYPTIFMVPVFLIASLLSFACHFLLEETIIPENTGCIVVGLLGVLRIAYVLWDFAIRNGDRVLLSSLSYLIPLLATVFLIVSGFSSPNAGILMGGLLIVAGCLTVNSAAIIDAVKIRLRKS